MAKSGCLLGYGPNRAELRRRVAHYVDRIFRGAAPGELPIERPTNFEFAINLMTARALGISTWRILFIHVLQNVTSPILVQATFIFAYAILAEAGLSFLGVGVPPALPTWGTMIAGSQQYAHHAIWLALFPGIAIVLSALSLQMVGDGFRDLLDPKLRKAL